MRLTIHAAATRKVAAACGAAVLLLGATACGNGGGNGNATGQAGPETQAGGAPGGARPGASGKVAAVDGRTAQVEGTDGQVAVTWTDSTTFTKEVGAKLGDVKVGDCVFVGSADTSTSSTPSTSVTAASVRITPKTDGSCGIGLRGPGTGGPGGSTQGPQLYGGPPPDSADGGQRPQMRMTGGAVGEVTAVSATGFTVDSVVPGRDGSADTTPVTVTVGSDTTYTTTAAGAASDVEVGVCLVATGTTDQTGAVTAKTIAVSQPQDGQCGVLRFASSDGGASSTKES